MELETFERLLGEAGQAVLALAQELYDGGVDPIRAGEVLRRTADPALAAAAMTQARLRRRAKAKLGTDARCLYFTAEGLEQVTRAEVATHRAARLSFARPASVLDLGCGIGGDLVAIARTGVTTAGVDLDPVRVAIARANLSALGLSGAVRVADATALDTTPYDVVFADPARRSARGRVFDVDSYVPSWAFVERLLTGLACVKVAPGIPHDRVPAGVEAEFVSFRGEVKEAALWSPALATTDRRATVIGPAGPATLAGSDETPAEVRPAGRFLLEPDGAVIRAGLVGAVAAEADGWLLDEHIAYVCTDHAASTPYARRFEVLEELPFALKRLKVALRERGIGRLTIKKRGVDVVPEQLRRQLALRGDAEATIVLTRAAGRGTALLVNPLD